MRAKEPDLIAVAWYTRDNFNRIRELSPNGGGLQDTFEEWLENAQKHVLTLAMLGRRVERIDIDPDALFAWLRGMKIESNEQNRARFVLDVMRARYAIKS